MTMTEQRPVRLDELPADPFIGQDAANRDEFLSTPPEQDARVTLEEARILWNAMSHRSFSEYRGLNPNSKAAITKRLNFARAFTALELERSNIVRGEE